jgi:hypothetical protein
MKKKSTMKSGSAVDKMKPTKGPLKNKPQVYTEVQDGHMKDAKRGMKRTKSKDCGY